MRDFLSSLMFTVVLWSLLALCCFILGGYLLYTGHSKNGWVSMFFGVSYLTIIYLLFKIRKC